MIANLRNVNRLGLGIEPYLTMKARYLMAIPDTDKSYDYYLRNIMHLVQSLYDGYIGGQFIDVMASLIQGQLTRAYHEAVTEAGLDIDEMTPEMDAQLEGFILAEYDFVDKFFRDIIDARIDETSIEPLINRARMWANRYNDVKNKAKVMILSIFGKKMEWVLGATEEHCDSCSRLNGLVAFASQWEEVGIYPQNPPNPVLTCGGWQCDCSLVETDRRRSPHVIDTLRDIAVSRNI